MQCIVCIKYQFLNNTRPTMSEAIDRSKTAVTVYNGDALCLSHLEAIQGWRKK